MLRIRHIVVAPKATKQMTELASYLYRQTQSRVFVDNYMNQLKDYFMNTISLFPESGSCNHAYGDNIRKLTYKKHVVLYRINEKERRIEIVNFFRDNLP